MIIVRCTDEFIIADIEHIGYITDLSGDFIDMLLGSYAHLFGDFLDLLTMLIRSCLLYTSIIAGKNRDKNEIAYEKADLIYHPTVMLVDNDMTWDDVYREMKKRR